MFWLLQIPKSDQADMVTRRFLFCALAMTTAAIVWRDKQAIPHKKAIYFVGAMAALFSIGMWGYAHLSGQSLVDVVLMSERIPMFFRSMQLGLAAALGCVLGILLRRLRHPESGR